MKLSLLSEALEAPENDEDEFGGATFTAVVDAAFYTIITKLDQNKSTPYDINLDYLLSSELDYLYTGGFVPADRPEYDFTVESNITEADAKYTIKFPDLTYVVTYEPNRFANMPWGWKRID